MFGIEISLRPLKLLFTQIGTILHFQNNTPQLQISVPQSTDRVGVVNQEKILAELYLA